jgi:hypothetical protein
MIDRHGKSPRLPAADQNDPKTVDPVAEAMTSITEGTGEDGDP